MTKSTAIAFVITLLSANAALTANILTQRTPGGPAGPDHVYYENAQCHAAARRIATYTRALSRIDPASERYAYAGAIYRQMRESERDWHAENCRPVTKTAQGGSPKVTP